MEPYPRTYSLASASERSAQPPGGVLREKARACRDRRSGGGDAGGRVRGEREGSDLVDQLRLRIGFVGEPGRQRRGRHRPGGCHAQQPRGTGIGEADRRATSARQPLTKVVVIGVISRVNVDVTY